MSSVYDELKLLEYVARFSKNDLEVVFGDKLYHFDAVERVILNPSFFRKDVCLSCGRCCHDYMINFTDEWKKRVEDSTDEDFTKWGLDPSVKEEIEKKLETQEIVVNGRTVNWYYLSPIKKSSAFQRDCPYLFDRDGRRYCKMHPIKSVTCMIPHIVVREGKDNTTFIRRQMYSRNHILQCPTIFEKFDYEFYAENDIKTLEVLYNISKDMGVDSYLEDVIKYLKSIDENLKKSVVPIRKVYFYKGKKGLFA